MQELYEEERKKNSHFFEKIRSNAAKVEAKPRRANTPSAHHQTKSKSRKRSGKQNLESKLNSLQKLHGVYREIKDKGHYITPSLELIFGKRENIPLDEASNQSMEVGEQMYNAPLTFTILAAAMYDSSVIYFGAPGTGKTTLAEYVSSAIFNLPLRTIQQATIYGNPELTEEKMIAQYDVVKMMKGKKDLIVRDFSKIPPKIIDEANRIPPSKLSILYQIVDRGITTYQNELISPPPGPIFATANGADSGNYDLPEPFVDRFDIGIVVQELDPYHYEQFDDMKKRKVQKADEFMVNLANKITPGDLHNFRILVKNTHFPSELMSKLAHFSAELKTCDMAGETAERKTKSNALYKGPGPLCDSCTHYTADNNLCSSTTNGLSARTISAITIYSKGIAAWRGSKVVTEEDLKYAVSYCTWFKLTPTKGAFEKNPRHFNDRIAWVEGMYENSLRTFDEITDNIPEYRDITKAVFMHETHQAGSKQSITKQQAKDLLTAAAEVDSLAKYPLMVTLREIYVK